MGQGERDRGDERPPTGGRATLRVTGSAARDGEGRDARPIRLYDRRKRAPRTRHVPRARSRTAACRTGASATPSGRARSETSMTVPDGSRSRSTATRCASNRRSASAECAGVLRFRPDQAATPRWSRAAVTRPSRTCAPPTGPSRRSTACSGWGIRPRTLPASLHTPATRSREPLTSAR